MSRTAVVAIILSLISIGLISFIVVRMFIPTNQGILAQSNPYYDSLLYAFEANSTAHVANSGVALQVLNTTGNYAEYNYSYATYLYLKSTIFYFVSNATQREVEVNYDWVKFVFTLPNGTTLDYYPTNNGITIPPNCKKVWTWFWNYPDSVRSFALQFNATVMFETSPTSGTIEGSWLMKLPSVQTTPNPEIFYSVYEDIIQI